MENEQAIYIDINDILDTKKNILERASSINEFCKKIDTNNKKTEYLNHFSRSITYYFASMYLSDLFDTTKNNERRKYLIFTNCDADIAYIFLKCIHKKGNRLKDIENFSQNILNNFKLKKSNNDTINILNFLENKYNLHEKIFKNETITFSILNCENTLLNDNYLEEISFNEIPKNYFLFCNSNTETSLFNELAFAISLSLVNKEKGIPNSIKEKLKPLGFLDIDNYPFNVQLKILKISLAIGLSYDVPFNICYKNCINKNIKKEYNSLLIFILDKILI